jgi:hypothetical protein
MPSGNPPVWASSIATVTADLPSPRNSGRYRATGASNASRPASTCCRTRIAVTVLVSDATSNTESTRIGTRWAGGSSAGPGPYRSASPTAACTAVTPSTAASTTAPA